MKWWVERGAKMKWMTQSGPAQRKTGPVEMGFRGEFHSRGSSLTSRKSKREIIFATPRLAPTPVAHAEAESWSEIDEIELLGRRRQIRVESREQQSRAARTHGCFQSLPELAFVSQRKKFGSSLCPIKSHQNAERGLQPEVRGELVRRGWQGS